MLTELSAGGIGIGNTYDYFRLAFQGEVSAPLVADSTATEIEAALEEMRTIDDVTVATTGNADEFTITFGGTQAETDVPQLIGDVIAADDGTLVHSITQTYDELYRVTSVDDSTVDYTFEYDALDRLTKQAEQHSTLSPEIELSYEYDKVGNRLEMDAKIGMNNDYSTSFVYDELNRLKSITQEDNAVTGNSIADKHLTYSFNPLGQIQVIRRFNGNTATNPSLRTSFSYDNANRLESINHQKVSSSSVATSLNLYEFEYDFMSRIEEIDSTADGLSTFTYDRVSQLTDASHSNGRAAEDYDLDATGNRDDSNYNVGDRNLTTTDGTFNYTYDNEGNRTRKTEISSGDYEEYTWDHRNRLTSVESFESGVTDSVQSIKYEYDAFNRLIRRIFDDDGDNGTNAATDTFFAGFDGLNATLEFDGIKYLDLTHRYLWGLGEQLIAAEVVTSLGSDGEILWPLTDQVGTIRDVGKYNSISGEFEIINHRVYDSFGNLTSETAGSAEDLAFGFTSRWTDPATGLTNHLNRWFDPQIGKWLSNDPIGFRAGDANVQRYVGNNPISFVDPNGLNKVVTDGIGQLENNSDHGIWKSKQDQNEDNGSSSTLANSGSTQINSNTPVKPIPANQGASTDIIFEGRKIGTATITDYGPASGNPFPDGTVPKGARIKIEVELDPPDESTPPKPGEKPLVFRWRNKGTVKLFHPPKPNSPTNGNFHNSTPHATFQDYLDPDESPLDPNSDGKEWYYTDEQYMRVNEILGQRDPDRPKHQPAPFDDRAVQNPKKYETYNLGNGNTPSGWAQTYKTQLVIVPDMNASSGGTVVAEFEWGYHFHFGGFPNVHID